MTHQFVPDFKIKLKLSYTQKNLMEEIAYIFQQLDSSVTWDKIQIYIFKSSSKEPVALPFPILDEDKLRSRNKKQNNNQTLQQITGSSNDLYYDILPISLADISNKIMIYVRYI
jgi:hypothetical protein